MNRLFITALWIVGAFLLSQGLYMDAKAKLAQILISSSWNQTTGEGPPPKPWWWADTRAIAKLEVPRIQKTLFVMQDESGESLAFGPGHITASASPSAEGHVMIAGHRDSHFEFIQELAAGDVIETTHYNSESKRYRVKEAFVIDSDTQELKLRESNTLTLITCYPFNGLVPGGSLRFVVDALEIAEGEQLAYLDSELPIHAND